MPTRSGSRLVTSSLTWGHSSSSSVVTQAADVTCSKLSSTSRTCRSRRRSASASRIERAGTSPTPTARPSARIRPSASRAADTSTNETPSRNRVRLVARRPGWPGSSCRSRPGPSASAAGSPDPRGSARPPRARPAGRRTPCVGIGRLAAPWSMVISGGKVDSRSGWTSWNTRSGRPRSLSRNSPRSRRLAPAGRPSAQSAAAAADSRTWPP